MTDAEKITQLEAELAHAREQLRFATADASKLDAERAAHARTQAETAAWKELHDRHCGAACCEGIEK